MPTQVTVKAETATGSYAKQTQPRSIDRLSSKLRITTWRMLRKVLPLADGAGDLIQQMQAFQLSLQFLFCALMLRDFGL